MALCSAYAAFDIQAFREAPYQTRGSKFEDVKHAALQENCEFCKLLYDIATGIDSEGPASQAKKRKWIHLRMSNNGYRKDKNKSGRLAFNRMDVMLSDRHALFTHRGSGEMSWQQESVQCRVLADPGAFLCSQ